MKVQTPFGFVTGCHAGDKFMVQATLANMEHFRPICFHLPAPLIMSTTNREQWLFARIARH